MRTANILLAIAQCHDATLLASQRTWRKLGRRVLPGEIPAALLTIRRKPVFARDGACPGACLVFATRYVFDLVQTTGGHIPALPTCERKERFAAENGLELEYVSGAVTIVADHD